MTDLVERLYSAGHNDLMAEAADRIERLEKIEAAALNLIAQKGRHNTEQAYKRLEEVLK